MNNIYSLRYSAVARGFIAVSEFARKCTCRVTGEKHLKAMALLLSPLLLSGPSGASIVSAEIDYQIFRDFAENKGIFRPGATDIAIYNNQGELVGTLNKAPMPDFSSVDSGIGVATLVNPQYIVSVKHNGGYTSVRFGDGENLYNIVDRNNSSSVDFHAPRLDKLVTEVAPATVTTLSQSEILDPSIISAFYRLGSGTQYIQNAEGNKTQVSGAYSYLTGGLLPTSFQSHGGTTGIQVYMGGNINDRGVMASFGQAGDSGSPLFGWNATSGQWELIGVYSAVGGGTNMIYKLIPLDFLSQVYSEDYDDPVVFDPSVGSSLVWTFDSSTGAGTLTQDSVEYAMHGLQGSDLNAGKNLIFQGQDGLVDLQNSVSQGAGSLTFIDNYTVTTTNGSTWTGAGIIVDKDVSVNWQVNGEADDNLHKIGEGTLIIQGSGVNEGGLKVGDGTVVLNQQVDSEGQVQAFSSVNIASGRPTVILTDDQQVNPDTVSWGYSGGTLDVNGNSLTFHQLKAADYGAVLANNADNQATITMDFDTEEYLYHGQLTGNMDVTNVVEAGNTSVLVMDGSADMSGTFTQENGRLTLQGHPVIHAYNSQSVASTLAAAGDNSVLTQPTSFDQDDWETRTFTFDNLFLTSTDFGLGRNAILNTTIEATNSTVTLGDSRVFIDKQDGDGTSFTLEEGSSEAVNDADRSVFNGSAVLNENTTLDIMNAIFNGDINGNSGSHVELSYRSQWNMTKSSTLDSLSSKGGTLSLVTDNWSPKTLTVNTLHASSMHIDMGVSTTDNTSDRIDILNKATGGHNTLDLSSLFDQTVVLEEDLTLASAPAGTSHGYFSFASLNRGFTVYTPDTQVQEKDGRVYWQLKSNAEMTASLISADTSNDSATDTTSSSSDPTENSGAVDGTAEDVTYNPDSSSESTGTVVSGSTLFKGTDNTSLLNKVRGIFAAREFILVDSADRWTQVVDNSDADGGAWAITGYSHGGYDDFTLHQSGLNIGFRQSGINGTWWGIGTELYRGYSRANDFRDDFSLWGGYILAGKLFADGLFVDGMVGYRLLSEDYTIQGELSDLSGRAKSHILTAGIRTGWKMYFREMDMTITPVISLNSAMTNGNRLQGQDRSVDLHNGSAAWLKTGVEAGKNISDGISFKAGIWRDITLNDMPRVTLSDDWKARHYNAETADRYTVSAGINGKLTEKLTLQVKVSNSFDGYFKTDTEGVLGVRYNF